MNQVVINIISGKGGTGKTLLSAVLAETLGNNGSNVLLIDLDVFVRGLTALLYYQKGESLNLIKDGDLPVSEFFRNKSDIYNHTNNARLAIARYRSFDIVPSVGMVNETLSFRDIMPNTVEEAKNIIKLIIESIPKEYDFILLDSRAGYDELISATHSISDFSICVVEDDNISMVTSDNLIEQLKMDSKNPIFILKNKVRNILLDRSDNEIYNKGLNFIGEVPFDIDVMNSFGSRTFWDEINRTMFRDALADAWNLLSKKMDLNVELKIKRLNPVGFKNIEKRLSLFVSKDRILFLYGLIIGIFGIVFGFSEHGWINFFAENPIRLISILCGIFGFSMSIFVSFRRGKK